MELLIAFFCTHIEIDYRLLSSLVEYDNVFSFPIVLKNNRMHTCGTGENQFFFTQSY